MSELIGERHPLTLTVSEVAHELRISRRTVYNLMTTGALHSIKVGGSRRVTRDALDSYIHQLVDRSA